MATLKALVDETTNIKNELVTCHTNLKTNLVSKGVEVLPTDKMSNLIDKVSKINTMPTFLTSGVSNRPIPIGATNYFVSSTSVGYHDMCLYFIGNESASSPNSSTARYNYLHKHDLKTNKTTYINTCPVNMSASGVATKGDNITFIGSEHYVYNAVTKTWTKKTKRPTVYNTWGICYHDDTLYAGCSRDSQSQYTKLLHSYDDVTDTWTTKASSTNSMAGNLLHSLGDNLFYCHHINGMKYNPKTNTWTTLTAYSDISTTIYFAGTSNDHIYATIQDSSSDIVTVKMSENGTTWDTISSTRGMFSVRENVGYTVYNGNIYIVGGYMWGGNNAQNRTKTIDIFNMD